MTSTNPTRRHGAGSADPGDEFAQGQSHDEHAERAVLGICLAAVGPHHILEAARLVARDDFYNPRHQDIWDAIIHLAGRDEPTDPIAVRGELAAIAARVDPTYLIDLLQQAPAGHPAFYARIVVEHAERRRWDNLGTRIKQIAQNGHYDAELVTDIIRREMDAPQRGGPQETVETIDELLAGDESEASYDWLIPGLLERHDRVILTAEEGAGKSTFLRQVAIMSAAGMHPFTGASMAPLTVLHIDVENSRQQSRREYRRLRIKVGGKLDPQRLRINIRLAGIDLTQAVDVSWLLATADAIRPDLLITGPVYKLANGDPTEEKSAKPVAMALDRVREQIGCAILLEAHAAKRPPGQKHRPHEPYGWSGWLRWPEFGLWLDRDGVMEHWRGQRDVREWPAAFRRGGEWPWTPVDDEGVLRWYRLRRIRQDFGEPMTERELADAAGMPKTTVHRVLTRFAREWLVVNGQED